jgi:PIN domain nuclease of toxin-antitoxin system
MRQSVPDEVKDRLDHQPDVRFSAATIWEIAIKQALGKITAPADLLERVRDTGGLTFARSCPV